jgi:hypothetical protein
MGLMKELFGFDLLEPMPDPPLVAWDFREDYELLAKWGQIVRKEFHWQSRWGYEHAVVSGKHPTGEAANDEARRMALAAGYRAPRWYEWWRWHEEPLPSSLPPTTRHEL